MTKILVIPHRAIGDLIFQLPLIKSLSENSNLIIIAQLTNKADLLLENYKNIKIKFFDFTDKKILSKIKFFFKLKKFINSFNADEVYCLSAVSWILLPIIFSKPKKKLLCNIFESKFKRKIFNSTKPSQITLDFINKNKIKKNNFELSLDENRHKEIIKKYTHYKKPWVFLSIDSYHNAPNWYIENYKSVINEAKNYFSTIFINTMPKHNYLLDQLNINEKKIILTMNYEWRDIMSLIKDAKIFIGNHSGPGHLADAMNVRSIIINNNTHKNAFWSESSSFLGSNSIYFNTWEVNDNEIKNYIIDEFKKK